MDPRKFGPGPKSVLMRGNLEKKKDVWKIRRQRDALYWTYQGTEFRILDSGVTDFTQEPLASIGTYLNREIILLQPSVLLTKESNLLLGELEKLAKEQGGIENLKAKPELVIQCIMNRVRKLLSADVPGFAQKFDELIKQAASDPSIPKFDGQSVLPIDYSIRAHLGVCRVHAVLLGYLMSRVMKDGRFLNPGKIHQAREKIGVGASESSHTWIIYKPDDTKELFLVDSQWNCLADLNMISRFAAGKSGLVPAYSIQVINRCKERFDSPPRSTATPTINPYEVLMIDRQTSQDEILKQFLELQAQYDNYPEMLQKLRVAYEMIETPEKRAAYDAQAASHRPEIKR